jgi:uncharacterized protein YbcI
MPGFEFRYRLSGKRPTVESFVFKDTATLSRGDILSLEDSKVRLGGTGDAVLVGAAVETLDGEGSKTYIRVVVDADAVYGIEDPRPRLKGATLDLRGLTGAQGVGASLNAEFVVDVDSAPHEDTLVRVNDGRHYEPVALPGLPERLVGGELNAAIARIVVRYHAEHLGRGPTKAHAFYRDHHVVVVLEGVMTRAERTLVDASRADAVLHTREAFQGAMGAYLRSSIERLTGCKVRAFMSANHLDPDLAAEVFILDQPIPGEPAQAD